MTKTATRPAGGEVTHVYMGDILKFDETPDGNLLVYGKATSTALDLDQQRVNAKWAKSAMPGWFEWANVREQHSPIAAGVGLELTEGAKPGDWFLKSMVVDENTKNKVRSRVLKGYSIGIKGTQVIKSPDAPKGEIVGGKIVEISLVDRPANPECLVDIAKSADGNSFDFVPAGDVIWSEDGGATMKAATLDEPTDLDGKALNGIAPEDQQDPQGAAVECPDCAGTGKLAFPENEQVVCKLCKGSGKVSRDSEPPAGPNEPDPSGAMPKAADPDVTVEKVTLPDKSEVYEATHVPTGVKAAGVTEEAARQWLARDLAKGAPKPAEGPTAAPEEPEEVKAAEGEKCKTCDGTGKIMEGNRKCPDCGGDGKVSKAAEEEQDKAGEPDEATEHIVCKALGITHDDYLALPADVISAALEGAQELTDKIKALDPDITKVGKVLSKKNADKLSQAHQQMAEVLEAAGIKKPDSFKAPEPDTTKGDHCPMCDGDGVVTQKDQCGKCDGLGKSADGEDCDACDGKGTVKSQMACPKCKGDGEKAPAPDPEPNPLVQAVMTLDPMSEDFLTRVAAMKQTAKSIDTEDPLAALAEAAKGFDPVTDELEAAVESLKAVVPEEAKKDYSDKERARMADAGTALPGGGYPIKDVADLKNAIQAFGRAKDPAATKAHIIKRAKALGRSDLIPDGWTKAVEADDEKGAEPPDGSWTHDPAVLQQVRNNLCQLMQAELDELMQGECEIGDLYDLLATLSSFLQWWSDEAWAGEDPYPYQVNDETEDAVLWTAMGVDPDVIKAAESDEDPEAQKAARKALRKQVRKVLGVGDDKIDKAAFADTVKSAVQEEVQPLMERLETVERMAAPGGPVRSRTAEESAKATRRDELDLELTAAQKMADATTDPDLKAGYRERVVELKKEMASL